MTNEEKPAAAFALSLIAGIFILLGGGLRSIVGFRFFGIMGRYGRLGMM